MEYVTRGVCGQEACRERRYYLDNGLWFCRRGHLQEVCMGDPVTPALVPRMTIPGIRTKPQSGEKPGQLH